VIGPGKPVAHRMDRRFDGCSKRFGARACIVLLACGIALTLGVGALFAASAPSFAGPRSYATGRDPFSVAIGDLNGDGKPDATANLHGVGVSVLINTPGLCTVQSFRRMTLRIARRTIARVNCRVGKIRLAYSQTVRSGRVISQQPKFGAVLPGGAKVNLLVSRGREQS
jgi:PASTA domain